MRLDSTRFGTVDVDDAAVIDFPAGLIGLGGSRYALVVHDEDSPFRWLQSVDDPAVALPVTSPWTFFADYAVELSDDDSARVGTEDPAQTEVWVTVRASPDPAEVTANLKAPIVVHAGRGHQVINEAAGAAVRAPLFG